MSAPDKGCLTKTVKKPQMMLITPCMASKALPPIDSGERPIKHSFHALWDTGATVSVISEKVVRKCNLIPEHYFEEIQGIFKSARNVPGFYVDFTLAGNCVISNVLVALGRLPYYDIIIGMDIIRLGDFAITNQDGDSKFTFRVPSTADFDFVKEEQASRRNQT